MSIYHLTIKIRSRSGGRSAISASAYLSGEKLHDNETGRTHDYTKKGEVIYKEVLLPLNAPEDFSNRETLWNEVQKKENRKTSQLARQIEVALPKELNREQQIECVQSFIKENFVSQGMIADWALHDKGDGNPHAHIMLTLRAFDENKNWAPKKINLYCNDRDENGKPIFNENLPHYDPKNKEATSQYRIPKLDENGKQKVRVRKGKGEEKLWEIITVPYNDWNENNAEKWRRSWANCCNKYLDIENQIDYRSYKRQGKDTIPTIHEGYAARDMEKKGVQSERCEYNREVKRQNSIISQIKETSATIISLLIEKTKDRYVFAKEKLVYTKEKVKNARESIRQQISSINETTNNSSYRETIDNSTYEEPINSSIYEEQTNTFDYKDLDERTILLKKVFPPETKIELVGVAYGYNIKNGSLGIVNEVDDEGYISIDFDDGVTRSLPFDDITLKILDANNEQLDALEKIQKPKHHLRKR